MKVLIPVKPCAAVGNQVLIDGTGENSRVLPATQEQQLNPFCAIALEQAVRLKESSVVTEVITFAISAQASKKFLQNTLALGADRALSCKIETDDVSPLTIAKIIKKVCDKERPDMVILGKQSVDYDNAQVGPMLAALLGWPQATAACSMIFDEQKQLVAECEGDDGEFTLKLSLPAVVTADLRLCEPRTAGLAEVMRSRRKQIEEISLESLGVEDAVARKSTQVISLSVPQRHSQQHVLANVAELVALIQENKATRN